MNNKNLAYSYVRGRLVPYVHCNKCGAHVLESDIAGYDFKCIYCDKELFASETHEDKELKEISDFDFEDMVEIIYNKIFWRDLSGIKCSRD